MIIGAPFDGGTSHRPGARFGPQAIRFTDYLPHDGSRPHLALGVDPLAELKITDVGDIELPSGDTELSLRRLEEAVQKAAAGRHHSRDTRRRPHHHIPRRHRRRHGTSAGAGSR